MIENSGGNSYHIQPKGWETRDDREDDDDESEYLSSLQPVCIIDCIIYNSILKKRKIVWMTTIGRLEWAN